MKLDKQYSEQIELYSGMYSLVLLIRKDKHCFKTLSYY